MKYIKHLNEVVNQFSLSLEEKKDILTKKIDWSFIEDVKDMAL
jgi:hypothetical protein